MSLRGGKIEIYIDENKDNSGGKRNEQDLQKASGYGAGCMYGNGSIGRLR